MVKTLGLAKRLDVASATRQLGRYESQMYDWRKKARYEAGRSGLAKETAAESARPKRQVAGQAEELAIINRPRRAWRKT